MSIGANPIAPGATIGIVGGGQLGRMLALAARAQGYRIVGLEPKEPCSLSGLADHIIHAPYEDEEALSTLAKQADVITFEFENIASAPLERAARLCPVYPGPGVLHICQNRDREKNFLQDAGFPVARFARVESGSQLGALIESGFPLPAIVKTANFGYDGKGQQRIDRLEDAAACAAQLPDGALIVEELIDFSAEYSVICARSSLGETITYPVCRNHHKNHILDTTWVPCGLDAATENEARGIAAAIAEAIAVVGLLVVEFFYTRDGRWIVNELAPRPHNSGHYSIDAASTSQFANHIRAICGYPLGCTGSLAPAVMLNLLGDLWQEGPPPWQELLKIDGLSLHLYDKGEPRPGRKMGHCTIVATDNATLEQRLADARRILGQVSRINKS